MDRFIEFDNGTVYAIIGLLKSSMDRFIVFSDNTIGNEDKF